MFFILGSFSPLIHPLLSIHQTAGRPFLEFSTALVKFDFFAIHIQDFVLTLRSPHARISQSKMMLNNKPPREPHRCAAHIKNSHKREKRQKSLYTFKNWKFEKLLEETKKYLSALAQNEWPRWISAEAVSIHFRSKLKRMAQVFSQLRKERLISCPYNGIYDSCWSTTYYAIKKENFKKPDTEKKEEKKQ